ncbi:unnamed protein product, partial [Rotaria socialis]
QQQNQIKSIILFRLRGGIDRNLFPFQLGYLLYEHGFFLILSPYNIIKSERQDYDDHIELLINKNKFHERNTILRKISIYEPKSKPIYSIGNI